MYREETMEPLQVARESESQAFRVRTLTPLRDQLFDPAPEGRDADSPPATTTRARPAATAAALTATLGLAAAAWVASVRQMSGMDMGVATELGSFPSLSACGRR
jgi:hypothetical protein